ncbi:transcription termination factor Rho [Actinomyces sp. 2119]|uniref:transcription termination factor Rho n=1 Tax=Actinomyces sp. 2119 TaxID=2321393 RepID=UPI000E6CE947|nr:transcription termination factor Rho [Actinomyces sp. 2119]RJF43241.1 transcription termination factor Rho [Actinomyces sp. 2119]
MTETSTAQPSLSTMRLAELQQLAGQMGLKGISRMRKSELVAAIREVDGSLDPADAPPARRGSRRAADRPAAAAAEPGPAQDPGTPEPQGAAEGDQAQAPRGTRSRRRRASSASQAGGATSSEAAPALDLGLDAPGGPGADTPDTDSGVGAEGSASTQEVAPGRPERGGRPGRGGRDSVDRREKAPVGDDGDGSSESAGWEPRSRESRRGRRRVQAAAGSPEIAQRTELSGGEARDPEGHRDAKAALMRDLADATGTSVVDSDRGRRSREEGGDGYDEDRGGRRRRGRKRGRDRDGRDSRDGGEGTGRQARTQPREEEVLLPVAGILDVTDNQHAYLRTSGYLSGPKDVYVPGHLIKDSGLRAGDAVTGWVREGGETSGFASGGRGNRRQGRAGRVKYNPLVSVDTVNGMDSERSKRRPDFSKLTPLYPQEQLRLETTPKALTPRVIDLVSPIGKGQRGLIVSPPKAGKTIVLQQIANAISVNNPEAHLMVVLVDERPEEVTDMQRTVKGEVIASTFDRPASDHTTVAELAIERAKRLVELGQDVVVLLDSITRLGRAYNLAAPASGRILSGGVDASALYPPKRFFGAARNIENGGSLTILATALVDTGSRMDEVIFEEFKGTGNMELRLSRQLAEKRIFPAVDVAASSTRREELLIDPAQLKIMWRLRRLFTGLEQQQALELVLSKLKDTQSNAEFLMVISKTTPSGTSLADADADAD